MKAIPVVLCLVATLTWTSARAQSITLLPQSHAAGVPETANAASAAAAVPTGESYEHYREVRNHGITAALVGVGLMGAGAGMFFGGVYRSNWDSATLGLALGGVFVGGAGAVTTLIGIPIMIYGSAKMGRAKQRALLIPTVSPTNGGVFAGLELRAF